MNVLGIDIGGSGIKGAPIDTETGALLDERHRIKTPQPATPDDVAEVVGELVRHFAWRDRVGLGFPGITIDNVIYSAANVDKSWMNTDGGRLFSHATGQPCTVTNDADAAGLAEMRIGAGKGRDGVVFVITVGTGLGTALFTGGHLVPNVELGHLKMDGKDAEYLASDAARKRLGLKWKKWAKPFSAFLNELEDLFSPKLFIIGGGASKKTHKFFPYLDVRTEVLAAKLLNEAGIIGAAMAAAEAGTS